MDELACQCATFINGCLGSDCEVVNFVARHGVYFRRMLSPLMLSVPFGAKALAHLEPSTYY